MRPQRSRRDGERGHAAILVGMGSVALLGITGLALDGGMEAGAFRRAQNAADAGALAAARQIYINAMSSPQQASTSDTLTPIAQKEVTHNHAQLAWVTATYSSITVSATASNSTSGNKAQAQATSSSTTTSSDGSMDAGGMGYTFAYAAATPTAATANQTVYVPTSTGGSSGTAAVADVQAPANLVDAHLQVSMTQSSAQMIAPADGGSVASSSIALGQVDVPSLTTTAYVNCWNATAHYVAGQTTPGVPASCTATGVVPVGVNVTGTLISQPPNGVQVDGNDAPTAKPRMMALNLNATDGSVNVTASAASSSNDLYWDPVTGITSVAAVNATNVHLATSALTADTSTMAMRVRTWIDPTTGVPQADMTCKAATVALTNILNNQNANVTVDQDCNVAGLPSLGMANVTMPWSQPNPVTGGTACSTSSSGQVTCSIQACFLKVTINATPYNSTVCLGETNVTLSAVPVSISCTGSTTCCPTSPCGPTNPLYPIYTGSVTVAATVPQATYFLRVLGWSQTNPTAEATADVESVVDETAAQFALSPFAMPDTGTSMQSPYSYERLQPGHTYYLYGPNMQSNNPAPAMPAAWQGQLDGSSAHRVGSVLTGSSSLTTTPQRYVSDAAYYLEPVFEPVTGVVLWYGVFTPVAGQPNWGTLVNSIPALHGYIVQATSTPGWLTFDEGAVSVKLTNNP